MHAIAAIILITIVLTARIANKWSLPLILIALGSGILFGSDIMGLVYFDDYKLAKQIADTALIFVLFAGGFGTKRESLKLVMAPALVLSTLGNSLITAAEKWFGHVVYFRDNIPDSVPFGSDYFFNRCCSGLFDTSFTIIITTTLLNNRD
jgi:NhaP-type Na+/H+ and K+/H+ antiporter